MKKLYLKVKKIFNDKGFTLVELLAVIVILAIIMLIAIPVVLDTMENAKRKSFIEYVDKILITSQKQVLEENLLGNEVTGCKVYYIKNDLGLSSTGNYDGYVIHVDKIDNSSNSNSMVLDGYLLVIWDGDYAVIKVVDSSGAVIENKFMKKDEFISYLKSFGFNEPDVQFMVFYSNRVSSEGCTFDGVDIPPATKESIITDGQFAHNVLLNVIGCDLDGSTEAPDCPYYYNYEFKRYEGNNPIKNKNNIITTSQSPYPVYVWIEEDTRENSGFTHVFYYYSDVSDIYLVNGDYMFSYLGLESIDLTGMLFYRTESTESMFEGSKHLMTVTFGSGDMSKDNHTDRMFKSCYNLSKIYVPEAWEMPSKDNQWFYYNGNLVYHDDVNGMFLGCVDLCGSIKFDYYWNDREMARLDDGYLTLIGSEDNMKCYSPW